MSHFLVSIVIPVFNEAKQIRHSLNEIRNVLQQADIRYECLLIDDGSCDRTWEVIVGLAAQDPNLKALRLSRNFGKEAALCAGLDRASGDACIIMDADLQHPPQLIPEMVRLWRCEGYPIVEAVKRSRGQEGLGYRLGAKFFYNLMEKLSGTDLHQASDFKLLDASIVTVWRLLNERQTFFRGLTAWLGFPRAKLYFEVAEREHGASKWSKLTLVKLAVTAITSFSSLPLHIVTTLGLLFLAGAMPLGIQALYLKFCGIAVSGFTTVILLLLIIGSILMISLGIIGTYIARIFEEVKHRPRYLVSEITALPIALPMSGAHLHPGKKSPASPSRDPGKDDFREGPC